MREPRHKILTPFGACIICFRKTGIWQMPGNDLVWIWTDQPARTVRTSMSPSGLKRSIVARAKM